jgi:hypothetical protein
MQWLFTKEKKRLVFVLLISYIRPAAPDEPLWQVFLPLCSFQRNHLILHLYPFVVATLEDMDCGSGSILAVEILCKRKYRFICNFLLYNKRPGILFRFSLWRCFGVFLRVVTSCSLVGRHWHFRGTCCRHFQDWSDQREDSAILHTQISKKVTQAARGGGGEGV